jgi:hypothetical protein
MIKTNLARIQSMINEQREQPSILFKSSVVFLRERIQAAIRVEG